MCGFVGNIDFVCPLKEGDILKMRDLIDYRGPDDSGLEILKSEGVALGHRRLSILDPTTSGKQPMSDTNKNLFIVYNGEIYNYLEIRDDLKKTGYVFKTETDTEVLLNAYDCWGINCLDRFIGMFAFVIWDRKKKELFAARDRLGIKPFYYYQNNTGLLFASEIKSIISAVGEKIPVDVVLIDSYMSFGYIPGEHTLNSGVKRLLPGHYMIFNKNGLKIRKYWDITFSKEVDRGLDHYVDKFGVLLNDSIDLRLRSDVPLGIFLSGGIDSSTIVALLAPRVSRRLKTFSVAYDYGSAYNETNYARLVANHFNTEHHELMLTSKQFMDFIPDFVRHMDEPVTESAAISLYFLSKLTKKHVTVVLSGEGSDELFGGYDFYVYNRIIEHYRQIMGKRLSHIMSSLLIKILPSKKIQRYLSMSKQSLECRYKGISTYDEAIKNELYQNGFSDVLTRKSKKNHSFLESLFDKTKNNDLLSRMLYFDTKTWLVDDLLIKADRMSMAASLELRVPFLDHRLVEFAAAIPSKYKINKWTTKFLLKKLMEDKLPRNIIKRKKMGFPTPLAAMFKDQLFEYATDTLLSRVAIERGYFKDKAIRSILKEHRSGIVDHHRVIWQLLVLEEWHRKFA